MVTTTMNRDHTVCNIRHWPLMFSAVCVLSACSPLTPSSPAAMTYDLGEASVVKVDRQHGFEAVRVKEIIPASINVHAPSWLESAAIQYRLDFQPPVERRLYANSQWVAPPSELLQQYLLRAFSGRGKVQSRCSLEVRLDEFIHTFSSPVVSQAEIAGTLTLRVPGRSAAKISEPFDMRETAKQADAPGGVLAHQRVVRRLFARAASWFHAQSQQEPLCRAE